MIIIPFASIFRQAILLKDDFMKVIITIAMFGFACIGAYGQDSNMKSGKDTSLTVSQMKNYIVMSGGKMMLIKNDTSAAFTSPMILTNGTSIRTDGTYLVNGQQHTLNEGDRIYLNGKIVKSKTGVGDKKDSSGL
jgi:hypothetical protein